ncbi:MAG: redoxin domain-containing protein [Chloroflexota bacterium]
MPSLPAARQRLPELKVLTATGDSTTIEAYLGSQVMLLSFLHSTRCPDCVSQLYRLQRHKQEIVAAGAEIVVVTRDTPEALAAFLLSTGRSLEYTVLADPDGATHRRVGAGGHTLALVVDHRRTVRWVMHWSDRHDESGYQMLLQVLQEAGAARMAEKV